jgi:hypothetical protein
LPSSDSTVPKRGPDVGPIKRDAAHATAFATLVSTDQANRVAVAGPAGIPINVDPIHDQGHGWLGAADVITTARNEFRKESELRKKQRRSNA